MEKKMLAGIVVAATLAIGGSAFGLVNAKQVKTLTSQNSALKVKINNVKKDNSTLRSQVENSNQEVSKAKKYVTNTKTKFNNKSSNEKISGV